MAVEPDREAEQGNAATVLACPNCRGDVKWSDGGTSTALPCPTCGHTVHPPSRGVLRSGHRLGDFRIEKLLAVGGMGEVYIATQISMNRQVALKILPGHLTESPSTVQRFLNEVRVTARIEHPHIVQAYEAGEDNGIYYLAMAYVKGDVLLTRIERDGPMDEHEALEIIRKIAGALAFAWNEHRVLHRDVKPANIVLDAWGEPKLMDLGLSKSLAESQSVTLSVAAIGTPSYMSPEQVRGEREMDCRSDMYSLGATLYHMVTGTMPFKGSGVYEILRKQVVETLPDPRAYNPTLSEGCIRLLDIMLAKDRDARHATWEALVSDIDRVLANQQPSQAGLAPVDSMLQPAARTRRSGFRRARVAWLAAAILAVMAGILAILPLKRQVRQKQPVATAEPVQPATPSARLITGHEGLDRALADLQKMYPDSRRLAHWKVTEDGIVLTLKDPTIEDLSPITGLPIVQLNISQTSVHDLGPVATLPLEKLVASSTPIADLDPLKSLRLTHLDLGSCTEVTNLAALAGLPIQRLNLWRTGVRDLSALKNMPLRQLDLSECSGVTNLSALAGLRLVELKLYRSTVRDLSPLAGQPLQSLDLNGCRKVVDLRPLSAMPLTWLNIGDTILADLSPLAGVPLRELVLARSRVRSLEPLKGMPLEKLDAAITDIADLTPLKGMPLTELNLAGTYVKSLEPLRGAPLTMLRVSDTPLASLAGIEGAPIRMLNISGTKIIDLSPIQHLPLNEFQATGCPDVYDLSPLAGMSLRALHIQGTQVLDLSPLAGMTRLSELWCDEAALRFTASACDAALRRGDYPAATSEMESFVKRFSNVPAMASTLRDLEVRLARLQGANP
jgi:Leucine-rich repeat (LRR) protein